MPDFGQFRGFSDKLFGDKLYAGQLPTQLGLIGSEDFGFVGLLDDYPNSAAAYSLRLLTIAYKGSAIQVRRSSDNTTQDIGFVDNELDTTSLASFCSGTDGFVTTWYDQSGNGNNATQSTDANQPQIVSGGSVITENGKATVQFVAANSSHFFSNSLSGQSRLDTFLVQNISNTAFVNFNNGNSGGGTYGFIGIQGQTSTSIYSNYGTPNLYKNSIIQTPITRGDVYTILNGYSLQSIINSSTSTWTAFAWNVYTIGGGLNTDTKMQELVFYPSDQSSNRTGIETNINDFYSIY